MTPNAAFTDFKHVDASRLCKIVAYDVWQDGVIKSSKIKTQNRYSEYKHALSESVTPSHNQ